MQQAASLSRRNVISAAVGAAAAWLGPANAQQPQPVVGILLGTPRTAQTEGVLAAFRRGLNEAGLVEGRNFLIEERLADGRYNRLPELANEFVRRPVTIIAAIGAPAATAAKAATTTIPVVFYLGEDPVSLGLVRNMNRPGGNVTGISYLSSAVLAKRLELLREMVPKPGLFAALINPNNPNAATSVQDVETAARSLGERIHVFRAGLPSEFEAVFAAVRALEARALLIAPDGLFSSNADQLAELSVRHAVPASAEYRSFAIAGGLMSYGGSLLDGVRQAGLHAARILKHEKPADLPVVQPTKFEMVINRKTAKTFGLSVPPTLLATADEVIE